MYYLREENGQRAVVVLMIDKWGRDLWDLSDWLSNYSYYLESSINNNFSEHSNIINEKEFYQIFPAEEKPSLDRILVGKIKGKE